MEPLAAVALFCNVIDLADLAIKAVKSFKELYFAPEARNARFTRLQTFTLDMQSILESFQLQQTKIENDSFAKHFHDLVARSKVLSNEVLSIVNQCTVKKPKVFTSVVKALGMSLLKSSDLEGHLTELASCRQALGQLIMLQTQSQHAAKLAQDFEQIRDKRVEKKEDKTLETLTDSLAKLEDVSDILDMIKDIQERYQDGLKRMNCQMILRSIGDMNPRRDEIHEAAANTFTWIFKNSAKLFETEPDLEISFVDWLKLGSGVFHITGKPGSGKSTLMKFLSHHDDTITALEKWAKASGAKRLIHANFFFWKPGGSLQNSVSGLIRGLLYGILKDAPELVEDLFPKHWNPQALAGGSILTVDLTDGEISTAFNQVIDKPWALSNVSVCFFIDGLDEYDDQQQSLGHSELARKLLKWTSQSYNRVKLCISSRQWPEFEVFPKAQRIMLHNLTKADIRNYVTSALGNNTQFQDLLLQERQKALDFIHEIVSGAEGVFLWVFLLLKSLDRGLAKGDSLAKLQRRLRSTPTAMNEFLLSMVDSIEDCYKQEAFLIMAIAMRATGALLSDHSLPGAYRGWELLPAKIRPEGTFLSLIGTSFLLETLDSGKQFVDLAVPRRLSSAQITSRSEQAAIQIRGRCNGLLEVVDNTYIKFTHRSIPEVLQNRLHERARAFGLSDAMVGEAMCWMLVMEAKHCKFELRVTSFPSSTVELNQARLRTLLHSLRLSDLNTQVTTFRLLDSLDMVLLRQNLAVDALSHEQWKYVIPMTPTKCLLKVPDSGSQSDVLLRAVITVQTYACYCGLHEYVAWKLSQDPISSGLSRRAAQLFYHAAEGLLAGMGTFGKETLKILLRGGVAPWTAFPTQWNHWNSNSSLLLLPVLLSTLLREMYAELKVKGDRDLISTSLRSSLDSWIQTGGLVQTHVHYDGTQVEIHVGKHAFRFESREEWWTMLQPGLNTVDELNHYFHPTYKSKPFGMVDTSEDIMVCQGEVDVLVKLNDLSINDTE